MLMRCLFWEEGMDTLFTQRMTIVVETPSGLVMTLSKGSDVSIAACLSEANKAEEQTQAGLQTAAEFASRGLRVLSMSYKVQSVDEYEKSRQLLDEATSAEEREELSLEKNQKYLGCLGICDPAEERVAPAIKQLGIKIFIVTGDQLMTTYACWPDCLLLTFDR